MEEPLKIGRVSIQAERALNISLTSDVHIYAEQNLLDRLAYEHPDNYLRILENVKKLIKEADFAWLSKDHGRIGFVRMYFVRGSFLPMAAIASHEGTPKRWVLESIMALKGEKVLDMARESSFVRLDSGRKKAANPPAD